MNIGMLLNAPYPDDTRVRKEARALTEAGHKVFLLCLRRAGERHHETTDGVTIDRIEGGKNNIQLAFWDVLMAISAIHPRFYRTLPRWCAKNSIEVLHVHDLPLVGTALLIRKKFGIPVVSDFPENYPDALRTWFEWKKNPLARLKNKLFMNPDKWIFHEKKAVLESDSVIAVVEEMKERLVSQYAVDPEKITVITNTETKDFVEQDEDSRVYGNLKGKFIVAYTGNIGPHRGVDTAIEAMQYLRDNLQIVLVVIGSGSKAVMKVLDEKVKELKLTETVVFLGRQPFSKFYSFMKFADVNLIPHKSNSHTDNTVPHKLFQSMMTGNPVLVSSSAPLKRIISMTRAGLHFEAGNAKHCADKISELYHDTALRKELGARGLNATLVDGINWEHTGQILVGLYESLQQRFHNN